MTSSITTPSPTTPFSIGIASPVFDPSPTTVQLAKRASASGDEDQPPSSTSATPSILSPTTTTTTRDAPIPTTTTSASPIPVVLTTTTTTTPVVSTTASPDVVKSNPAPPPSYSLLQSVTTIFSQPQPSAIPTTQVDHVTSSVQGSFSFVGGPVISPSTSPPLSTTIPTMIGTSLLVTTTPLSALISLDVGILPTTFVISRRPSPTTLTTPSTPTSPPKTSLTDAARQSSSTGLISGIVVATLFLLLLIVRPKFLQKRREQRRQTPVSSVWECLDSSSSSSSCSSTIEVKEDLSPSYAQDLPHPPPLAHLTSNPPSTPPLSGLYSPGAWATMLATPERRPSSLYSTDDSISVYSSRAPSPAFVVSTATVPQRGLKMTTGYLVPSSGSRSSWNSKREEEEEVVEGEGVPVTPRDEGLDGF